MYVDCFAVDAPTCHLRLLRLWLMHPYFGLGMMLEWARHLAHCRRFVDSLNAAHKRRIGAVGGGAGCVAFGSLSGAADDVPIWLLCASAGCVAFGVLSAALDDVPL